jgi:hypothetical protein
MKKKSTIPPAEEEAVILPAIESVDTPDDVLTVLKNQNDFFAKFLKVYNYKQKQDLRAHNIRLTAKFTKGGDTESGKVRLDCALLVELDQTGEVMVLSKNNGIIEESDVKSSKVVEAVVDYAHEQLMNMMRHGLATVIRTAQKKGAEIIL